MPSVLLISAMASQRDLNENMSRCYVIAYLEMDLNKVRVGAGPCR